MAYLQQSLDYNRKRSLSATTETTDFRGHILTQKAYPNADTGGKTLMAIALGCAIISGLSFYTASRQPKQPIEKSQNNKTDGCVAPIPAIARYPSSIRGTTKVNRWLVFDQTLSLNEPKLAPMDAPEIPGGTAGSLTIDGPRNRSYDIGVSMKNQRVVRAGETVTAEVWLRGKATTANAGPVSIQIRLQDQRNGFRVLKDAQLVLSPKFTKYELSMPTAAAFCPGDLNFALHLATGAQILDIGPGTLKVLMKDQP